MYITEPLCESMAARLECPFYHSTSDDKIDTLKRWTSGETSVIVAKGALGTDVDSAGITEVIHFGTPCGLVKFSQETGLAGCGDEMVTFTILFSK